MNRGQRNRRFGSLKRLLKSVLGPAAAALMAATTPASAQELDIHAEHQITMDEVLFQRYSTTLGDGWGAIRILQDVHDNSIDIFRTDYIGPAIRDFRAGISVFKAGDWGEDQATLLDGWAAYDDGQMSALLNYGMTPETDATGYEYVIARIKREPVSLEGAVLELTGPVSEVRTYGRAAAFWERNGKEEYLGIGKNHDSATLLSLQSLSSDASAFTSAAYTPRTGGWRLQSRIGIGNIDSELFSHETADARHSQETVPPFNQDRLSPLPSAGSYTMNLGIDASGDQTSTELQLGTRTDWFDVSAGVAKHTEWDIPYTLATRGSFLGVDVGLEFRGGLLSDEKQLYIWTSWSSESR